MSVLNGEIDIIASGFVRHLENKQVQYCIVISNIWFIMSGTPGFILHDVVFRTRREKSEVAIML